MQHSRTTWERRSFTQDSKGYSRDLRHPVSSSNCAAPEEYRLQVGSPLILQPRPAFNKALTMLRFSTLCFQSAWLLFRTVWILLSSSSRARPEKIVTFFTFSKASRKDSSSTAPADPAEELDMNDIAGRDGWRHSLLLREEKLTWWGWSVSNRVLSSHYPRHSSTVGCSVNQELVGYNFKTKALLVWLSK